MDVLKVKVGNEWIGIPAIKGDDGQDGISSYVHIKYSATEPSSDSDMKSTADAWMGVYSGASSSAPDHYTDYTWYKIKGEQCNPIDVQIDGTSIVNDGVANIHIIDDTAGASDMSMTWSADKLTKVVQRRLMKANISDTLTLPGNGAGLMLVKRGSSFALLGFDYWTANYEVIAGTLDSAVIISKAGASYEISISNTKNIAIEVLLI